MKTKRMYIAFILTLFFATSCKNNDDTVTVTKSYFPLEVGNSWLMAHAVKKEITGTKTINNKTYYLLSSTVDTSYYRIEDNKVYRMDNSKTESLQFNLSAKVNDTWNSGLYTIKLASKTDTVTINKTKIPNCYRFYFDIPGAADDEHSIWLAPGIGIVQQQCECVYPIVKLTEATIDGKKLTW